MKLTVLTADLEIDKGNDEKCRMYLEKLRWPEGVRCVRCDSDKISQIYKRKHLERYLDEFEFRFNNRNNLVSSR